jgi:polyphenol oxidase
VLLAQQNRAWAASKTIAPELLVWLGPCIGPQQFEVGADVKAAFDVAHSGAARHFQTVAPNADQPASQRADQNTNQSTSDALARQSQRVKYRANLQALARDRLHALGITHIYGNDGSDAWCTISNPSQFFSHRRDAGHLGSTGRMAACVWLK